MTERPGLKSVRRCAACWAVRRYSPSASCWFCGGRNPNPTKRRHRCVGASPPPRSARRLKAKRSARRANPARHPPQHPTPGAAVWPSDHPLEYRPAPLVRPAQRERPAPDPVHAASVQVAGPSVPPQKQDRAVGRPRQEARQPPAPPQGGFARLPAASPVGQSILQHGPSLARGLRNAALRGSAPRAPRSCAIRPGP